MHIFMPRARGRNTLRCHERCGRTLKTEVSLCGTRDAAANWQDCVCQGFDGSRPRSRSRMSVFILFQRTWDQRRRAWKRFLERLEQATDKHFGAKHTMMGESRGLKKSTVMINTRISWRSSVIMYELDTKHCHIIFEALNLQQARQCLLQR